MDPTGIVITPPMLFIAFLVIRAIVIWASSNNR